MRKLVVLVLMFSVYGCGADSDSDGGGSNPNDPNAPNLTDGGSSDFYPVSLIAQKDGSPFPRAKFPSLITDGKLVDACKKGQVFHNDECFDGLHLDENLGFKLVNSTNTVVESDKISDEFLAMLSERKLGDEFKRDVLTHRITYDTGLFGKSDLVFWGNADYEISELHPIKTDGDYYLQDLYIDLNFIFPSVSIQAVDPQSKYDYEWQYNGSLTIKGKTFNFPITHQQLQDHLGNADFYQNDSVNIKFSYKYNQNVSEQVLEGIHYSKRKEG